MPAKRKTRGRPKKRTRSPSPTTQGANEDTQDQVPVIQPLALESEPDHNLEEKHYKKPSTETAKDD